MSQIYTWPGLTKKPTKRVIIAGSRDYKGGIDGVAEAVKASAFDIEVVLSGCARGVDRCGEQWAARHGIAVETHFAKWDKHGRGAGSKRVSSRGSRGIKTLTTLTNQNSIKNTKALR